ncbi:MAG: hypothetical protein VYE56_01565 [Pseudomonadota bacterium]|nr:hypothetical protein [Pseudomonadota bacterium]
MYKTAYLAFLLVLTPICHGQQIGCGGLNGFSDFDFWVGEWEVFDSATGEKLGEDIIQKIESGCLLLEHWKSVSGGTGTSLNYYNPVTREWRQVWVSEGRYSIDIVGGIRSGSMVLEGSIYNFAGAVWDFRGNWTPRPDGSVRQFFEQFNHDSNDWATWFDRRYVRKDPG